MSGSDKDKGPVRSGRVRHEPGGRAIWEWAIDSGRHAIDSTSRLLKKLDLTSLRLLGDDEKPWNKNSPQSSDPGKRQEPAGGSKSVPTFGGPREQDPLAHKQRGFNPYDSRAPVGRRAAPASRPTAPPKPRITQPVRAEKKPGLLAKLFGRGK